MSPESLEFHIYSNETDVFAFGIVLWEIATLGKASLLTHICLFNLIEKNCFRNNSISILNWQGR